MPAIISSDTSPRMTTINSDALVKDASSPNRWKDSRRWTLNCSIGLIAFSGTPKLSHHLGNGRRGTVRRPQARAAYLSPDFDAILYTL